MTSLVYIVHCTTTLATTTNRVLYSNAIDRFRVTSLLNRSIRSMIVFCAQSNGGVPTLLYVGKKELEDYR